MGNTTRAGMFQQVTQPPTCSVTPDVLSVPQVSVSPLRAEAGLTNSIVFVSLEAVCIPRHWLCFWGLLHNLL